MLPTGVPVWLNAGGWVAEVNVKLLPPALKSKLDDEGGWGLKPVLWLVAPKAGKDEEVKLLVGVADCDGGKLLVAPPNVLVLAPNMPFVLLLLLLSFPPTAGAAEAPKVKPLGCGAAKLAFMDGVCRRALASRLSCSRRIRRRPSVEWNLFDAIAQAALEDAGADVDADAVESARVTGGYLRWLLLLVAV
jgi:hypothetical protein